MQGFNMGRYVPPSVEGTTTGNALHGKHPLGSRASKLASHGSLTVRFEMPFAVWCSHCPKPTLIGQGVRFNASKTRVGHYHTTPIFAFRMRHAACGGALEIRTDPAHTAYVVVEGGRRRDTGEDRDKEGEGEGEGEEGGLRILTEKEREALRSDAFAKLERTIADRAVLDKARERIGDLEDASARLWEDPYKQNRRLRESFRVGRKAREGEARTAEELRERMALGIELVPASEEDARRAKLVDFGAVGAGGGAGAGAGDGLEDSGKALAKPLFSSGKEKEKQKKKPVAPASSGKKRLKSEIAASQVRENIVSEIVGNTRAARDPFLFPDRNGDSTKSSPRVSGIKRKRPGSKDGSGAKGKIHVEDETSKGTPSSSTALVEYDSD
ncbi:CWC16 protein [Whalleya microplaca]|nr:CWC16 protein [Whalleya microplaca]